MKKKEDLSSVDKTQWEEYLKNPKDIFDKEQKNENSFSKNYKFRFDLHGYTLADANEKVSELIINCHEKGFREILFITGKGLHSNTDQNTYVSKELSKLKFSVPEYINSNKNLSDKIYCIEQASIAEGGEGAFIVKLKKL